MGIGRLGHQPIVVDGATKRKMVEILEGVTFHSSYTVSAVVEEAANAGGAYVERFRLQVEQLADQARLPVKALVEGGTTGLEGLFELRHHGDRVDPIGGDRLAAAQTSRRTPYIALGEEVEREVRRARGLANPCSLRGQMVVEICRIPQGRERSSRGQVRALAPGGRRPAGVRGVAKGALRRGPVRAQAAFEPRTPGGSRCSLVVEALDRTTDEVTLGRMEVAAEGPAGLVKLLPDGEASPS